MDAPPAVTVAGCLLATLFVTLGAPSTFASGEPQESFLYQNFVRASEVLERAVAAHGGAKLLEPGVNVRFSFTGTYRDENHNARPWARKDYRIDGMTLYSADLRAMKSEVKYYDGDKAISSFAIVGSANGIRLSGGKSQPEAIPEKELESSLREELEVLPHEYLRQARSGAAGLRLLSGAKGYEVIAYTLDGDEGRALFFDAKSHLLMRVERIGHWKHKGDRLEWRTFSSYTDQGGIKVPLSSEVHVEDSSTQHNVVSKITTFEFEAVINAEEFAVPAAFRAGFEGWTLQTRAIQTPDEPLPFHDLGKGAYIIDLPPSDARSLLVAFADFAVIVEAGDYSEISARLLATADYILPGKPVRYVAMTHHHPLYTGGLRPYVQRGITVFATAGDVAYYRDLVTRPYRIQPDEQQRKPREPKFELIEGTRILDDGTQRLELHEYAYSTHVDEFVLPYLPSHKLIVTADQVYVLRDGAIGPASGRERALHRLVTERKLDVQNIMQTWFLSRSDHQVPYSILEEKVRMANERDSKK